MNLQHLRFIGVVTVFCLAIASGNAQVDSTVCSDESCSCADDISPAGIMISHSHSKGEWMLSYRPMQMRMSGQQLGQKSISESEVLVNYRGSGSSMLMNMQMLMLMGGLTDRITLMAMFHYQSVKMEMTMQSASRLHRHTMRSKGIGDTKAYILFAPVKNKNLEVITGLGLNLPTGSIYEKGAANAMMSPNLRLPYSMQNGTGTFDILPSVTFVKHSHGVSYSAQIQATLRTRNNALGYRLGDVLETNFWIGRKWLPNVSSTLRLTASTIQKTKGQDVQLIRTIEPAANSENSGAYLVLAAFGSSFHFQKPRLRKNKFSLEASVPLYQNFNGIQMKNRLQIMFAWNYSM